MDVDGPETDKDYVMVSNPASPRARSPPSLKAATKSDAEGDVEMSEVSKGAKPSVPVRKTSESVMMFGMSPFYFCMGLFVYGDVGRQHDVAECMDSCLFQLECAELVRSSKLSGTTSSEKSSIVKRYAHYSSFSSIAYLYRRLFYGKIRQRVKPESTATSRHSIHEKDDLFSHLPVNVSEEGFDIYDGLSRYFDDTVEFEGKKARMEVSLVDLPPLLQIQLQVSICTQSSPHDS